MSSKLDYLSKYTSAATDGDNHEKRKRKKSKKEKKKKRHKSGSRPLGTNIVDDEDFPIGAGIRSDDDYDDDDGPVVVGGAVDALDDGVDAIGTAPKGNWQTVGAAGGGGNASGLQGSQGSSDSRGKENSLQRPKRRMRHDSSSSSEDERPRPTQRHDSSSDEDRRDSGVRKRRHDSSSDDEKPRRNNDSKRRQRYDSSSEDEEGRGGSDSKRKQRVGSASEDDEASRRRGRSGHRRDSSEDEDQRKGSRRGRRHDSDEEDNSGQGNRQQRRKRYDSSSEGDKGSGNDRKRRRSRRRDSSSDSEHGRSNSGSGARRKKRYDSEDSNSDDGHRSNRKRRDSNDDSNNGDDSGRGSKAERMTSGHKAGLQNYKVFNKSEEKIQARKHRDAQRMVDKHGMGDTVYRDKDGRKTAPPENTDPVSREQAEADERKRLNQGKVQKEVREAQAKELAVLQDSGFARYRDDDRLEEELKNQIRKDDPMAKYTIAKQQQSRPTGSSDGGPPPRPTYKGPPAKANRFGIKPGYRWDANDRGNDFEDKLLAKKYNKSQRAEQAYRYSAADM